MLCRHWGHEGPRHDPLSPQHLPSDLLRVPRDRLQAGELAPQQVHLRRPLRGDRAHQLTWIPLPAHLQGHLRLQPPLLPVPRAPPLRYVLPQEMNCRFHMGLLYWTKTHNLILNYYWGSGGPGAMRNYLSHSKYKYILFDFNQRAPSHTMRSNFWIKYFAVKLKHLMWKFDSCMRVYFVLRSAAAQCVLGSFARRRRFSHTGKCDVFRQIYLKKKYNNNSVLLCFNTAQTLAESFVCQQQVNIKDSKLMSFRIGEKYIF